MDLKTVKSILLILVLLFGLSAIPVVSAQEPAKSSSTSGDKNLNALIKKAEQGNALAQFSLGSMYYFGDGVKQDYAEAAKWYRKAAIQGEISEDRRRANDRRWRILVSIATKGRGDGAQRISAGTYRLGMENWLLGTGVDLQSAKAAGFTQWILNEDDRMIEFARLSNSPEALASTFPPGFAYGKAVQREKEGLLTKLFTSAPDIKTLEQVRTEAKAKAKQNKKPTHDVFKMTDDEVINFVDSDGKRMFPEGSTISRTKTNVTITTPDGTEFTRDR